MTKQPKTKVLEFEVDPYQGMAAATVGLKPPKGYRLKKMIRKKTTAKIYYEREEGMSNQYTPEARVQLVEQAFANDMQVHCGDRVYRQENGVLKIRQRNVDSGNHMLGWKWEDSKTTIHGIAGEITVTELNTLEYALEMRKR